MEDKDKKEKSLYYIIETINLLVENEKTLLKRIQKLETQLKKLAKAIVEDGLSRGDILYKPDGFDDGKDDEEKDDDLTDKQQELPDFIKDKIKAKKGEK